MHCHRELRVGRKDVLLSVSRALEAKALELGDHAVVVATFQDARGPDRDRRFEFVLTFDRDLVVDVAAALIARVASATGAPPLALVA